MGIQVPSDWKPPLEVPSGRPYGLPPGDMVYRYLETTGDGSGTVDAIGNYAATATAFKVTPPANRVYALSRMIVQAIDTGAFDADKYGNNITLTNGILALVRDSNGGTLLDLCDSQPIKTNAGWAAVCYDSRSDDYGTGNNYLSVRWTFSKAGAWPLVDGSQGQDFAVVLNDDFTGLIKQTFMIQGFSYLV